MIMKIDRDLLTISLLLTLSQLSLADIRTAVLIEHFAILPQADQIMELINKSEAILKVRDTVARDPKIAAWRASQEGRTLTESSVAFFVNPFAGLA